MATQWVEAAKGTSLFDLTSTIGNMELTKGTKVKVIMDLTVPVGSLFNLAAADWLAEKFTPDGMEFVDAYGEGSQGVIEMEADPAWLLGVLLFMKAHWVALAIAGVALWAIIASIIVLVKIAMASPSSVVPWAIGGGLLLVGVVLLANNIKGSVSEGAG